MAAPADFKGYTNAGTWVMNQKLSDDTDAILAAQGVGYLKRKAIGLTTVTVVNTVSTVDGNTVVKSSSSASGIPGAVEEVHINGGPKHSDHSVYGKIITTCTPKKPEEIEEPYLTAGFTDDSKDADGKIMYIYSVSDTAAGNKYEWTGIVTSGFQNVDVGGGQIEKRWCRLNYFKDNKGLEKRVRLVYDHVSA